MYFKDLQEKLIDIARERVHAGHLTERGLARKCGLSQPHMHNVLKKVRLLSTTSADHLLQALEIGIPDLLWRISPHREAGVHIIPMMRGRIGPGVDAALTSIQGYIPMPAWRVQNLIDPIGARVGSDLVLPRELATHDLVLLDQNPNDRAAPGSGLWVVTEGAGLRVRYLSLEGTVLRVGNDATRDDTARWHSLQLQGRNILDLVRARIVWMGREMERAPAGPADQAGQGH